MTTIVNITRRVFLQILFSISILGPLRLTNLFAGSNSSDSHKPLSFKLANFFLHKRSAKRVGLEYLQSVPMEADVHLLTNLICSYQAEWRAKVAHADSEKLRHYLLLKLRQDFEQSRTVNINGWILSETEARLCALAALI